MANDHMIEIAIFGCISIIGIVVFVWAISLSDAVPEEYRSASPGFAWSWPFDYEGATREAGRFGEAPWPWPAKQTGNRIVLPLNQPLISEGLEITYLGITESGRFKLDIAIQNLDSSVTYSHEFGVPKARGGFTIADRQFKLEKITSLYVLLHAVTPY